MLFFEFGVEAFELVVGAVVVVPHVVVVVVKVVHVPFFAVVLPMVEQMLFLNIVILDPFIDV